MVTRGESEETTYLVRRALEGDEASWCRLVDHLSPLLELQASYRLRGPLEQLYDAQDLVHEVWLTALPRMSSLTPRDGRLTPVLVRFLGSILTNTVRELLRRHIRRSGRHRDLGLRSRGPIDGEGLAAVSATTALSRAARSETRDRIDACIARLEPADQEVLILRGIEGLSNTAVAQLLEQKPSTVAMRYKRTLEKLRQRLPETMLADLEEG